MDFLKPIDLGAHYISRVSFIFSKNVMIEWHYKELIWINGIACNILHLIWKKVTDYIV